MKTTALKDRVPVLRDDILYSGDNGRLFCGRHAGVSARYTGRDISGQRVEEVTAGECDAAFEIYDVVFACEEEGCGFRPSACKYGRLR